MAKIPMNGKYKVPPERRKFPCRYRYLNSLERSELCNGCGGKGGLFNPPDYRFTASCDHHDFNYFLGWTKKDRKQSDVQFLGAMLQDSDTAPSWWRRYWLKGAAWRYYWAVRLVGGKFFYETFRVDEWRAVENHMTSEGYDPSEAYYD